MSVSFDDDVTLTVEVAFGEPTLKANPSWTDISAYVRAFSIKRGRTYTLDDMQAGTLTLRLDNRDGRFDPLYTSGAYYPNVEPGVQVRVQATYNSVTYPLFRGAIESWPQSWPMRSDNIVTADAVDGFSILNKARSSESYLLQASHLRIEDLLTDAYWPSPDLRDVTQSINVKTMQAYTATNESILDLIKQVVDSEWGVFFIAADGDATFYGRYDMWVPRTSQATFGDDGSELRYSNLQIGYDDTQMWNRAEVTRRDGETRSYQSVNATNYGVRTLVKNDLLLVDDNESEGLAEGLVWLYVEPQVHVKSLTVDPRRDPSGLWPKALGLELTDAVTIKRRPLSGHTITFNALVEGIVHEVDAATRTWRTTYNLTNTGRYESWWVLGTGELGSTTELGF